VSPWHRNIDFLFLSNFLSLYRIVIVIVILFLSRLHNNTHHHHNWSRVHHALRRHWRLHRRRPWNHPTIGLLLDPCC
jgi:hypothetical protein